MAETDDTTAMVFRGVRNLTYLIIGIIVGITWLKGEIGITSGDLLSQDTIEVQSTLQQTQELKNEAILFIETHDIIDANGQYTAEWLQFKSDQRAIAERRGRTTSIEDAGTWLQSLEFW